LSDTGTGTLTPDDFYQGNKWLDEIESMFKTAKPMMDFINSVIDDYE
jgi:hypothetical protein